MLPNRPRWVTSASLLWGMLTPLVACSDYEFQSSDYEAGGGYDPEGGGSWSDGEGPDIAVDPSSIAYGLVEPGNAVTENVHVTNAGPGDLLVTSILLTEGGELGYSFALPSTLPWTLESGESKSVVVAFAPEDGGSALGTLEVLSNDPDEPSLPVDLSNLTTMECTDDYSEQMPWLSSGLWYDATAPLDDAGKAWSDPAFDDSSWAVLGGLPDEVDVTSDHDVFYRASFELEAVVGTTQIEFQGNDGVWLYVNGSYVGHWGGEWREGGCINDPTGECSINTSAPPVDVTPYLQAGANTIAVMLTNGPTGYYLDIIATCTQ